MPSDPPTPPAAARVKTVACLGGVSLERGVLTEEIAEYLHEPDNLVWVDVQDPGAGELAVLEEVFGFHPLALADLAQGPRRPRVNEYKGYLLLVTHAAVPGDDDRDIRTAEVDVFVGRNYLVSAHRGRVPALDDALARWTRGGPLLRDGVGFLLYAVLDAVIDSYAPVIQEIEDEIEETELAVFTRAGEEGVRGLLRLKRELVSLRRVLYPLREMFQHLLRRDHTLLAGPAQVHLRDVYEHVLRILDVLDTEREMAAGALEASMTVSSNRLNRTMKTLAVITVAVALVGSVFGAYGMNFDAIPLAKEPWGFWAVSGGTFALVAVLLLTGWRKGWL
ncbi:MAG: magnesium/cobalt transporter CorA [Gemmataceae bacterium]|nr:magnesium/cobalt transporter CorA [Gemmataceae bacterium]